MKRRTILIALTGVLVIVVGLAVWFTLKPPTPVETVEEEDNQRVEISRFELDLIQSVELDSPNGTLELTRIGEQWLVDYPHEVELDQSSIEDLLYSFSRLYSERIVEENPTDLQQYGLEPPVAVARAVLTDGTVKEFHLGERTPARNTYYLQEEGNPTVYAVWMNHGNHFQYVVDDIRRRSFPAIDPQNLVAFRLLRRDAEDIEIIRQEEQDEGDVRFSLGFYQMTRPYRQVYGVDTQDLSDYFQGLPGFRIEEFVADGVRDFSPYGLDRPAAELFMQDPENTIHLFFGDPMNEDMIYFREAGVDSVYAMRRDRLGFLDVRALTLVDKFAFIVNIEDVDQVVIRGPELELTLSMTRKQEGEETVTTYLANGQEVEEDAFKDLYQSLIGMFVEAENPTPSGREPTVSLTYSMNKGDTPTYRVGYVPHDVDFYEVYVQGVSEFLMSREQVENMVEDARNFVAENVGG